MSRHRPPDSGLNSWGAWSDHHGMPRTLRASVALVVTLVIGFASTSGAGAASVSPSKFTSAVCAAIADGAEGNKAATAALTTASTAYKASPTPTTAAALRDALTHLLQSVEQQVANALTAAQQSGTPTGGKPFVGALNTALEQAHALGQQLVQHSAAIDLSSPAALAAGLQQVEKELKDGSARLKKLVKANAAFKHAPRAYRPLVVYMTTDADTCPKR